MKVQALNVKSKQNNVCYAAGRKTQTKIHFIKSIHPAILYNLKHSTSALKVAPISGLPMYTDRECNCSLKIPSHCKGQWCGEQFSI